MADAKILLAVDFDCSSECIVLFCALLFPPRTCHTTTTVKRSFVAAAAAGASN